MTLAEAAGEDRMGAFGARGMIEMFGRKLKEQQQHVEVMTFCPIWALFPHSPQHDHFAHFVRDGHFVLLLPDDGHFPLAPLVAEAAHVLGSGFWQRTDDRQMA
jgi:hypothetical protein